MEKEFPIRRLLANQIFNVGSWSQQTSDTGSWLLRCCLGDHTNVYQMRQTLDEMTKTVIIFFLIFFHSTYASYALSCHNAEVSIQFIFALTMPLSYSDKSCGTLKSSWDFANICRLPVISLIKEQRNFKPNPALSGRYRVLWWTTGYSVSSTTWLLLSKCCRSNETKTLELRPRPGIRE